MFLLRKFHSGFSVVLAILLAFLFLAGCTEYERSGYSPVPQNSPASWELTPFGDLRN